MFCFVQLNFPSSDDQSMNFVLVFFFCCSKLFFVLFCFVWFLTFKNYTWKWNVILCCIWWWYPYVSYACVRLRTIFARVRANIQWFFFHQKFIDIGLQYPEKKIPVDFISTLQQLHDWYYTLFMYETNQKKKSLLYQMCHLHWKKTKTKNVWDCDLFNLLWFKSFCLSEMIHSHTNIYLLGIHLFLLTTQTDRQTNKQIKNKKTKNTNDDDDDDKFFSFFLLSVKPFI